MLFHPFCHKVSEFKLRTRRPILNSTHASGRRNRRAIPARFDLLLWQTPGFFDFAKSCKHLFILFIDGVSLRYAEELDEVSMGTVEYDKRRRAVRPPPMLAVVTEFFGFWDCSPYVFIGYIRGIVHYVRDVRSSYAVVLIRIYVSPQDWGQHVGDTGSLRRFVVFCFVTVLDDLL